MVTGGKWLNHKGLDGQLGVKHGCKKGNDAHQSKTEGNDVFRAGIAARIVDLLNRSSSLHLLALVPGGTALVLRGSRHVEYKTS